MTIPDGPPGCGSPAAGDEVATLPGSLERQRATFAGKAAGLDSKALAVKAGTSTITLAGLIKHLAFVEDLTLTTMLPGRNLAPPWDAVDWDRDPAWPRHPAAQDRPRSALPPLASRRPSVPRTGADRPVFAPDVTRSPDVGADQNGVDAC